MKPAEAITRAIYEEGRLVTVTPASGLAHEKVMRLDGCRVTVTPASGLAHEKVMRLDGCREDVQRVLALAASLVADHYYNLDVPWAEAQLGLHQDLSAIMVHDMLAVADEDTPMTFIFPNIPLQE